MRDVWFGEYFGNAITMLDPNSGRFTRYPMPMPGGNPYEGYIDKDGNVWTDIDEYNSLVKFDSRTMQFTDYPYPDARAHTPKVETGADGCCKYSTVKLISLFRRRQPNVAVNGIASSQSSRKTHTTVLLHEYRRASTAPSECQTRATETMAGSPDRQRGLGACDAYARFVQHLYELYKACFKTGRRDAELKRGRRFQREAERLMKNRADRVARAELDRIPAASGDSRRGVHTCEGAVAGGSSHRVGRSTR